MPEFMNKAEESVYRMVERLVRVNSAMLRVTPQASDALERLIQRGQVREIGYAVEIVPDFVRETYIAESRPQTKPENPRKPAKQRRPPYSPVTGLLPARIQQLGARIIHWIENNGDQDDQGRPVCPKRALERGLHASRLPEWTPAINHLLERGLIVIVGSLVTVLDGIHDLPDPFDPDGRKAAKELKQARRRSRRKRPLSAWVKRRILERGGEILAGR